MNDMILILNYSDEFAAEAARRLRGEQVFSKIISGMTTAEQIREIASCSLLGLEDLSTSHIIHRVMNEGCGDSIGH